MLSTIAHLLSAVHLGNPVTEGGLTLIPVFGDFADVPPFLTLGEAIEKDCLLITEVDEGGRVPTLQAANKGDLGILILDGEEVLGAKQNRILNTTVYLAPGSEMVIPVSCTEHGRWSYVSDRFADSGYVAAHKVRACAQASVTKNVRGSNVYMSDQGAVWKEVAELHDRHGVAEDTGAMRDVYAQRRALIDRRHAVQLHVQPDQCGIFGLWAGSVIGFDVVASAHAYSFLHARLMRSYALDALVDSGSPGEDLRTAKEFLVALADAEATLHDAPGDGISTRFTGPDFVGSMLSVDDKMLHTVFFSQ